MMRLSIFSPLDPIRKNTGTAACGCPERTEGSRYASFFAYAQAGELFLEHPYLPAAIESPDAPHEGGEAVVDLDFGRVQVQRLGVQVR
jgi:hypothetical protein